MFTLDPFATNQLDFSRVTQVTEAAERGSDAAGALTGAAKARARRAMWAEQASKTALHCGGPRLIELRPVGQVRQEVGEVDEAHQSTEEASWWK